jgi:hypothetical protein
VFVTENGPDYKQLFWSLGPALGMNVDLCSNHLLLTFLIGLLVYEPFIINADGNVTYENVENS